MIKLDSLIGSNSSLCTCPILTKTTPMLKFIGSLAQIIIVVTRNADLDALILAHELTLRLVLAIFTD